MKKVIVLVTLLISFSGISQEAIQKTVGEFSKLKVYDLIKVELIKSDENKVVINGDKSEEVVIVNKNGTLKIRMNIESSYDGSKTSVKLYYTTVDIIDVNEGASVQSSETIKQFEIELNAQEGGMIHIPVDATYVSAKAVTGGVIETKGQSKNQKISLLTGGVYKGEELVTENTDVSINAAGKAYVNATKLVDVKVRAGGDVYIYGNPETVNESNVLGGRVERVK
ncbi:head GIN domain-containing protein [uncultured Algibacter sp.]|uniref:head GIN domain-containing protein n=1 Tax=uncultured Algibacter sp. TaxID=298659 RepID=UPI0026263387|nr:head GIN domain-containing protein [uncultured Algibacter sp.]